MDKPEELLEGVSFEIEIEDNLGRRRISWTKGNAKDVTRVFGANAGAAMLASFHEPLQLRVLSESQISRPSPPQFLPPPPPPQTPNYPDPDPRLSRPQELSLRHPSRFDALDVQVLPLQGKNEWLPDLGVRKMAWRIPEWLQWQNLKRDRVSHVLIGLLVMSSLASENPLLGFSIRTAMVQSNLGSIVQATDYINPVRWFSTLVSKPNKQ